MSDLNPKNIKKVIALINFDESDFLLISNCHFEQTRLIRFTSAVELVSAWESTQINVSAIISKSEVLGNFGINIIDILEQKGFPKTPVFLLVTHFNENLRSIAMNGRIVDVFELPMVVENIEARLKFTVENWISLQAPFKIEEGASYKTPIGKRLFDILFSGGLLLFLLPLFAVIYLLIKIGSKGPAFYYSYRVGTGYKIFKFYKFRSMYINADKKLQDLKHLNQYDATDTVIEATTTSTEKNLCGDCKSYGKCQFPLYADNNTMCEKEYMKSSSLGPAFIKIKDDPRVTKIGNFIRNTSIDELPQLWNVFIGDMSLVGNRPLPLYEAEKLTTDKYSLRFYAPAGITGLWQVEKRGKGGMSEDERLMLDNSYALNHSFKNDLMVILKTIPALLQTENV